MIFEDRGDVEHVASANECTGLVPALRDDVEEEQERRLYDVKRAKRPKRRH